MQDAPIEKSTKASKLSIYSDNLSLIESESFDDLYAINFYVHTLAKKQGRGKGLLVVHDKGRNSVNLSIVRGEDSFFVS